MARGPYVATAALESSESVIKCLSVQKSKKILEEYIFSKILEGLEIGLFILSDNIIWILTWNAISKAKYANAKLSDC